MGLLPSKLTTNIEMIKKRSIFLEDDYIEMEISEINCFNNITYLNIKKSNRLDIDINELHDSINNLIKIGNNSIELIESIYEKEAEKSDEYMEEYSETGIISKLITIKLDNNISIKLNNKWEKDINYDKRLLKLDNISNNKFIIIDNEYINITYDEIGINNIKLKEQSKNLSIIELEKCILNV